MATGSFDGQVQGLNQLQQQEQRKYGRGNYMPNVRVDLLVDAGDGLRRRADVPRRGPRRVAVLAARSSSSARWFHWTALVAIALPYIAATAGWILTEMGRQPWIVQGLLQDQPRRTRRASARPGSGISLGVFIALYARSRRRRLRAHAPLRARRRRRASRRRARRCPTRGGELLMNLQIFWFCLIGVLWAGYFVLEGFDFGVGMLLPFLPRERARARRAVRVDRPGLGRQRGLARRRGRRDVRGVPGLVRDDVLGLLPRAAAHPLLPDHPRRLVRVAREERQPALARRLDRREHARQLRRRR